MLQTLKKIECYCHSLLDQNVKVRNPYVMILDALQIAREQDLPMQIMDRSKLTFKKAVISDFIAECESMIRRDKLILKAFYKDPIEACEWVFFEVLRSRESDESNAKRPKLTIVR